MAKDEYTEFRNHESSRIKRVELAADAIYNAHVVIDDGKVEVKLSTSELKDLANIYNETFKMRRRNLGLPEKW